MLVGFVALVCPVAGFAAVWSEAFDGPAIPHFGVVHPPIAVIAVVGFRGWGTGEKKKATENEDRESGLEKRKARDGEFHKAS